VSEASWSAERERLRAKYPDADRLFRALVLAPTYEIGLRLLRGESVPLSMLNPESVERLGVKK
jgi:hypothetical protein